MGSQFVYFSPLSKVSKSRMDYVFFIPPPTFHPGRSSDFDFTLDNAWYGRVSLLFKMHFSQWQDMCGGVRYD
jgi:hypothetical protein